MTASMTYPKLLVNTPWTLTEALAKILETKEQWNNSEAQRRDGG